MLWAAVTFQLVCVVLVAFLASRKDLHEQPIGAGGWVFLTVLFGVTMLPLFWLVTRRARAGLGRGMRRCPDCAEDVRVEARVCRYCGRTLDRAPDAGIPA